MVFAMVALVVGGAVSQVAPVEPESWGAVRARAPDKLCEELAQVGLGEKRQVYVAGLYSTGFEMEQFYDPRTPLCDWDVQSSTYLEFGDSVQGEALLDEILSVDHRAFVLLRGTLWGPAAPLEDDPSLTEVVAQTRRRFRPGYGHGSWLLTKIVVDEVVEALPVPADFPSTGDLPPRPAGVPPPTGAELPFYPAVARRAGITGDVVVEVTVQEGRVVNLKVVSGDRVLAPAVVQSIRTWRFASDVNAKLTSTFSFALELRRTGAGSGDRLMLELPAFAKIIGAFQRW